MPTFTSRIQTKCIKLRHDKAVRLLWFVNKRTQFSDSTVFFSLGPESVEVLRVLHAPPPDWCPVGRREKCSNQETQKCISGGLFTENIYDHSVPSYQAVQHVESCIRFEFVSTPGARSPAQWKLFTKCGKMERGSGKTIVN